MILSGAIADRKMFVAVGCMSVAIEKIGRAGRGGYHFVLM